MKGCFHFKCLLKNYLKMNVSGKNEWITPAVASLEMSLQIMVKLQEGHLLFSCPPYFS